MNNSEKLLKSMIGDQGYETLEKAIFKRGTSSVVDPLEYYLPLIVVPRTILSWLIQTIKPMKRGELKEVKFPGKDDIMIHFEKQDVDQYRAEFVQAGRVIHSFEKQSLPAVAGQLMTTGEMYDSFAEGKKPGDEGYTEDFSERVKSKIEEPKLDMVKEIISMNDVKPSTDSESVKWEMSHANVRELTGVIGKLVDALMVKEMSKRKIEEELDKVSEKEVKDQQGKLETSTTPEEKAKQDAKSAKNDSSIVDEGMTPAELHREGYKQVDGNQGEAGKEIKRDEGKITKQAIPETIERPNPVPPVTQEVSPPASQTPMTKANSYFRKKAEVLMKPVAITKGETPKGAGQPVKPSMPTPPKPPVPAGNNPAQAAAKQAQSSARGSYTPPKTPGAAMPKNPTNAGQTPKANKPAGAVQKSDYFKSKLNKSEKYTATEGELYKSKCPHCQVPEFKKNEEGHPVFNPCACFAVMKRDEEGNPYKFVDVIKKSETGNFELKFHQNADPDAVKVFLLTLKAHLLVKRKFDV